MANDNEHKDDQQTGTEKQQENSLEPESNQPTSNNNVPPNETKDEETSTKESKVSQESPDNAGEDKKNQKKRVAKKPIVIAGSVVLIAVVALLVAYNMGAFHQHTWKGATCTEPKTCTECGATEGDPLGHDYQEKDVAATCTEGGKRIFTCSRCGDSYTEDDGTPATGHTPGDWQIVTASMKYEQKCTTCGKVIDSRDLTRDDINQVLQGQEVTLDSCKKEIESDQYKALYPDMVMVSVTNHSDKVVRHVNFDICTWDENGYPISTRMAYSFGNASYSASLVLDDANIMPGNTWSSDNENYGWQLDFNSSDNVASVAGVITSAEYADGTVWNNPYSEAWHKLYEDKQL